MTPRGESLMLLTVGAPLCGAPDSLDETTMNPTALTPRLVNVTAMYALSSCATRPERQKYG
jgi:hypothetical protein